MAKSTQILVDTVLSELSTDLNDFNTSLGNILDTLTDEECNPLNASNSDFIVKLQAVAYNISKRVEAVEEDRDMLNYEFENN
jgi:hypothetical protein